MSHLEIALVSIAIIGIVIGSRISSDLRRAVALLQSLNDELFHLAQEQNPQYPACDGFGRRAVVRHVLPRDGEPDPNAPDMFYCQPCWWLSSTVRLGDEGKYFKDRLTRHDIAVANAPGI
jgi:hypothetical protein